MNIQDNLSYESINGLGEDSQTILPSWITDWNMPIPSDTTLNLPAPSSPLLLPAPPVTQGFNWASLIVPIEKTGLQIAQNVTNPAYNTPGSFTRLADGTVIATAGTAQTGYSAVSPTSFSNMLSPTGGGGSLLPILLVGGALLLVVGMMGKH